MAVPSSNQASNKSDDSGFRLELDSHTNMVVVGRNSFIFAWTGKSCDVRPFMDGLGTASNVPIVDAAMAYDCPYEHKTYILLFWNAL